MAVVNRSARLFSLFALRSLLIKAINENTALAETTKNDGCFIA